jgi:hypothetical protein
MAKAKVVDNKPPAVPKNIPSTTDREPVLRIPFPVILAQSAVCFAPTAKPSTSHDHTIVFDLGQSGSDEWIWCHYKVSNGQ